VEKHRKCRRFPNPHGVDINIIQLLHVPCYILWVTSIDHKHITAHSSEEPEQPMNPAKRSSIANYEGLLADVVDVIADARRAAARVVNATMTTTYWFIGRRIIEEEQRGSARADYGEQLVKRLALDLSK
jgi:hypothetical protein